MIYKIIQEDYTLDRGFVKNEQSGIVYYTVFAFDKTGLIKHAFSTRLGGVSSCAYESLNLSVLTSDKLENVWENRKRFLNAVGIEQDRVVGAHQVHHDTIYQVTTKDKGAGAYDPQTVIPDTDALMTNETGLALTAFFADCVPVLFLDPVKKVIALAHAGWKGTVAKIAAKTAEAMMQTYGCAKNDILVAIGPSIGPCHYEVDKPVIEKVREAFPDYWTELFAGLNDEGHGYLNLWEANFRQLRDDGIPAGNISTAGLCTNCNQDLFFSHRRGMAGRQAAVIMLV